MKKFSKLTALILSLVIALSLALPTWALEYTVPSLLISPDTAENGSYLSWDEFLHKYTEEDHPELYENFDADAWFAKQFPWEDKEEFLQYMGPESETMFKEYMWISYLNQLSGYFEDYADDPLYQAIDAAYDAYLIETYEARHPGELSKLKTEVLLANQGYTKTLTPIQQFMEDNGLSDQAEVRPSLLSDYALSRLNVEDAHVTALAYQELYPEQWAEFDADAWFAEEFSYWNSKKDYTDYYYLITEEEFREDMFIDYVWSESWKWSLSWGDSTQTVTLAVNGETVEAEITLEGGSTYTDAATLNAILGTQLTGDRIPIRQTAKAAGWDVVWNPYCKQVALYHKDSLPQGDYTQFDTLMNRLLSTIKTEKGQSYKTTQTIDLKLTAFNSLDGDKTYTARITAELLQKDNLYELTVTVNAADLLRLLPKQFQELFQAQLGIQDLSRLLRSCKFTMLLNGETGMLYFNAPFLNLVDSSISADTWYSTEVGMDALFLEQGSLEWNTNDFLYQTLLDNSAASYWSGYFAYPSYIQTQEMLGRLFGPQNFTEQGGTLTWSLNAQSLQNLLWQEDEEIASLFKEFEVKLSVNRNGKMTSDAVLRLDMDALAALITPVYDASDSLYIAFTAWMLNRLDFRMESHASGTAERSSGTALFHWKNQFKLELSTTSSRQKVTATPNAAPPEDAEIIYFF